LMTANFLQGLFAQQIGIAFTGCCEIDDLVGYGLFDVIVAVSNPQGDADHFECDTQDVLGLGIEFVAVKEWRDGHGALPISGGSTTGLSATGAWRKAVADDEGSLRLIQSRI
jgi:hypothetical protein